MTTATASRLSAAPALVAAASGLMAGLATYSFGAAVVRLVGALGITAESIAQGVSLPAAAIDGVSTGTFALGRMAVTTMYDGNDAPLPEAYGFAASLREIAVPFAVAEALDAALVLALSIVVVLLCLRLVRRRPFARSMTWSLVAFAGILAAFSVAAQAVRRIPFTDTESEAWTMRKDFAWFIKEFQHPVDGQWDDTMIYEPAGTPLPLDLTLVGVAVLIALVAAAFAVGHRLQRDTEGLV